MATDRNSCKIDVEQLKRGGIRTKVMMDYIYISKKNAVKGGVEYENCVVTQIRHPELHHMMVVSSNYKQDHEASNIDIEGIFVKNYDSTVYNDDLETEREALELSAKVKAIR